MKMSMRFLVLGMACVVWSGCVSTIDGKHTGGVPFVKDTVEGIYNRPMEQVWKAAKATLASEGTLTVENVIGYTLEATLENRTVWVRVEALSPKESKVLVQVRTKAGGSDRQLAATLDKQIAVRLTAGDYTPTPPAAVAPKK